MAQFFGSVDNIPNFIKASTPLALVNKIRRLQRDRGIEIRPIAIYFDGKEHVAWYHDNVEDILSKTTKGDDNVNSKESEKSA